MILDSSCFFNLGFLDTISIRESKQQILENEILSLRFDFPLTEADKSFLNILNSVQKNVFYKNVGFSGK